MRATKVEILRESVAKIVPMLAGQGVSVTQMGMQAYVRYHPRTMKPIVVNIPYVPDNASEDLLIAVQGFIDHEVAHVLFSEPKYIKMAQEAKVSGLYGIIEDTFIERRMKSIYAGSKANLTQTWQFVQERIVNPEIEKAKGNPDPGALFGAILVPLMRLWSGQKELKSIVDPYLPALDTHIKVIGQDLIDRLAEVTNSEDGFKLAVAMHNRLEELQRRVDEEREEKRKREETLKRSSKGSSTSKTADDVEDSVESTGDDSDEGSPSFSADGDSEKDAGTGSADDPGEKEGDIKPDDSEVGHNDGAEVEEDGESEKFGSGEHKADEPETEDAEDASDTDSADEDDSSESGATPLSSTLDSLKAAFDKAKDLDTVMDSLITSEVKKALSMAKYRPFTKDLDVIEEFKPKCSPELQQRRLDAIEAEVASHIAPLQRHLERCIAAKSHSRMIPGHRSGRINPTALHRIATGDERLFRRKHISRTKNAAVSLVVDLSGSMGGQKIELAIQSAFAMSASLDRLNITHEVIGFTTVMLPTSTKDGTSVYDTLRELTTATGSHPSRIEPIYMPIFKSFNSRLTSERRRAFASYKEISLRNNTDGEAVEYAARRLAGRTEARKIMIVLSDGQPHAGPGDHLEQAWHLRETVKRLDNAGIETFGIGIMDGSVADFYPRYVVINSLDDLPKTVMQQLERLLLESAQAA